MMVLQQTLIVDNLLKKGKIWKISLDAARWIKEACKHFKRLEEREDWNNLTICKESGIFCSDHSKLVH